MKKLGVIEIPNGLDSEFDHAAFDPRTRRVFIAHTARDCIEVINHDAQKHIATLPTGSSVRTMTGAGAHTTAICRSRPALCDLAEAWRRSCSGR
jgi:hypothetical protein